MIADLYVDAAYWALFLGLLLLACVASRARLFDFTFMPLLIMGQYVAHTTLAFSERAPDLAVFALAFALVFVATYRLNVKVAPLTNFRLYRQQEHAIERTWVRFAKLYLLTYFLLKIALNPFSPGELLLEARLEGQRENRILFYMGIAILPAVAACMHDWIRRRFRLKAFDLLLVLVIIVGMFGAQSKSALLPLLLAFFGAASYMKARPVRGAYLALLSVLFALLSYLSLKLLMPSLDAAAIGKLLAFRIVANTDSLEYLYVLNVSPSSYPYAGIGALLPYLAKPLGYIYHYPPGVWLHSLRFDVWDGFGPNSGLIMDFYGNLSWFGLAGAGVLGVYLRWCQRLNNAIGCSFASIAYLVVVDISMFDVALLFYLGAFGVIAFFYAIAARARQPMLDLS